MKIEHRPSNFSQFSKDLWLVVEHDDTRISFDVEKSQFIDFAQNLITIAMDCIKKHGSYDRVYGQLECVIEELDK